MKKAPLVLLLLMALTAKSQEKESLYAFDIDWKPAKIESARYFLRIRQENDSCWQWDYYNMVGPLLKTEQYGDNKGEQLNGVARYYNEKGFLDSATTYRKGKKEGDSYRLSEDSFHIIMKYVYRDDSLIEVIDLSSQKKDTTKYKDEKESEYPGGVGQWLRYINKHLKYPDRAVNGKIGGEVRIYFSIDKSGQVQQPYVARSVEYSLDDASLRIVRNSGKWVPAFKNGNNVKSDKIQPVIFVFKKNL